MKKTFIAAGLAVSLLTTACGSSEKTSYTIHGEIAGIPDSSVVLLSSLTHTSPDTIAEAVVTDGKFEITGVAEEPRAVTLYIKDNYGSKVFMLENADISINGVVKSNEVPDGKLRFDFDEVSVSGSPMTDTYNEKMSGRRMLDSMFMAHQAAYRPLIDKYYEARQNGNSSLVDSIDASEEYNRMRMAEKNLFAAADSIFDASVIADKDDFWGPLLMISQTSYLSAGQRDLYESLSDSAKNSYYGRLVYDELYPVGRPGDKMPEFEAVTIDGTKTGLAALCKDKKYVILDFWASWCGPCRREIPNLKKIYSDFADKGFDIISVSIDKEEKPWINAVENEGLKWVNIRDIDHSIADKYKVSAVPTMYIVDSEGRLVAENLRGEELAAKIKELFQN
ncbi:TlpA disulfide reductase family protein [uncultured Duncaniella sp.]|uniref:TlpA disulfide reductase family protein n=1 Tax=uncultured Duncaniella sp. TaxID=2768039 RepID=UPI0025B0B68D|nr:TlpA disulfide reductase family protein [uncultured Duncaniella sp.]